MHIDDLTVRRWLQRRMETTENRIQLSREAQLRILTRLTDAITFEEFIRKKFVGAKSFSLEGSESLIPLLDLAIEIGSLQHRTLIVNRDLANPALLSLLRDSDLARFDCEHVEIDLAAGHSITAAPLFAIKAAETSL